MFLLLQFCSGSCSDFCPDFCSRFCSNCCSKLINFAPTFAALITLPPSYLGIYQLHLDLVLHHHQLLAVKTIELNSLVLLFYQAQSVLYLQQYFLLLVQNSIYLEKPVPDYYFVLQKYYRNNLLCYQYQAGLVLL